MKKEDVLIYSKKKVFNLLKNELFKKDEIIFAYLHGSFLDGFLFNDIDIALYLKDKKILEYARNNLEDFDRFLESIVDYLEIKQQLEKREEPLNTHQKGDKKNGRDKTE